jgi:hypothetical protein
VGSAARMAVYRRMKSDKLKEKLRHNMNLSAQHLDWVPDCFKRDGGDSFVQRIWLASGIDDPKMIKPKVLQGDVHGSREARGVRVFEFEAESFAGCEDQQVQFRAAVGGPVIGISRVDEIKHMFEGKAFPGRAQLRMTQEVPRGGDLEQGMEDATVTDINLRRLDLSLFEILKPRGEHADHVSAGEDVQVTARGVFGCTERSGEFRSVPNLPVVVGYHGPEASKGLGWDGDAQLRNVAFEKRANEILAPTPARAMRPGQKGPGESPAVPQPVAFVGSNFLQPKTRQIDETDPSCQRFRGPLYQFGRGASENKKLGLAARPVDQHSKDLKQIRLSLDFVDNDEPLETLQRRHGGCQLLSAHRAFEVKNRARTMLGQHTSQCRFAALPWAQERRNGMDPKHVLDSFEIAGTINHTQIISLKILKSTEYLQETIKSVKT